ncbi:MAG: HemK family protein methyltransferase [Candidatus Paceibacterota bacterium]|jgi:release factor glutamine methyltransferase|nr:HemK family protein methyltransferase [Candidatus Paceibacterota bacterium]
MNSNKPKEDLWLLHEKYGGQETPGFFEDLRRIEAGEPVDYVIGFSTFLGAKIDLSYHPLIPRTETEFWVEKAMEHISMGKTEILDMFAGSGCIGIAILKHLKDVSVDFGEKDPLLIKQIEKNIDINNIDFMRAHVYETDVFANIPQKKYDYIFANPPYVSHDRKWQVARPVLEHEPHLAIFTDDDGLFFVKQMLNESPNFLTQDGMLFLEFDQWQKEKIEKLVEDSKFEGVFWRDQYEKWRVAVLTLKN